MAEAQGWDRSLPPGEDWGGCRACVHFRPTGVCIAFPDQIPIAIASGDIDHLVIRPGQVGKTVFKRGDWRPAWRAWLAEHHPERIAVS